MASRFKNLTVDIGADFSTNVVAYANGSSTTPLNLTNWAYANSHVKKTYYHANTAAQFNVWIQDATSGVINLYMNRANTNALSPGNYVYDVIIRDDGLSSTPKTRFVEGIITATPGVSK